MSDLICFSRSRISPTSTSFIQQQRSIGSKMFKASSMLSVMLLVALFCLVIFTATTVNSQEKSSTTSAPASVDGKSNDAVLVEEIGETPLMKEKPVGTPSKSTTDIPVLGEDEDDDFEDYDPDDFAVLGNEWLLKEIKEIEEQIQTVSSDDEDVGDVTTKSPSGSNTTI